MSECKLDHSQEDVQAKLESQQDFLPGTLAQAIADYLNEARPQQSLNDLFHLLKKYDLVSQEEQEQRNAELTKLVTAK